MISQNRIHCKLCKQFIPTDMKPSLLTTLFISIFTIMSCASSQQSGSSQPAWVDDPYATYSESQYMAAVGSGSTQNEAQDQALAGLSRIFESRVDAEQTITEEFEEWEDGDEWFSESNVEVVNFSRISTDQDLVNAQVVETHLEDGGVWYALASLNRNETARVIRDRIEENRSKISDLEGAAENQSRIYRELGLLQQARNLALENEVLAQQRNTIRGGGAISGSEDLPRLSEKVRNVREECIVSIAGNSDAVDILPAVRDMFQQMGYIIGDSGVLEADVSFNPQYADLNRDDAEFVRWTLSISVDDPDMGQSIATFSHDGRDGALSYSDALIRAEYSARQHIEQNFQTFIEESIINVN